MSRSGYTDDCENLELYRQALNRAMQGKRGIAFLRELADALDAMPVKELIAGELIDEEGDCCAIGAVCLARGMDASRIDYESPQYVAKAVGIAWSMAAEIEHINDEWGPVNETPAQRWTRVRSWVWTQIYKAEQGIHCDA